MSPGVVHHVALATGARHRQQMVVQHEDAQERLVRAEALLDPLVAAAADQPVVEVGLGGVHGEDRHAVQVQLRPPLAEQLLEVDVPDVARVVVARDHDHPLAGDLVEVLPSELVLGPVAVAREVSGHDHHVGRSSFTSTIARSSRLGTKLGEPQWMSDSCAIVRPSLTRSPSSVRLQARARRRRPR